MSFSPLDRVRVDISSVSGGYDILVGDSLLESSGEYISSLSGSSRAFIVTDSNVSSTEYFSVLCDSLSLRNIAYEVIEVPAGESSKSFGQIESLTGSLLEFGIKRDDVLVAFGGGVIGDLAGLAAGLVLRGVRLVQVPTTLLAQVDSSVGGKTGINTPLGKNLIGMFHQPSLVLIDPVTLTTLSAREMRAGYAEIAKYAMIGVLDAPIGESDFFGWLESHSPEILNRGTSLRAAIVRSCRTKAAIVMEDEKERGARALLNLGHTFGHALESASGYDSSKLVHGEAVSVGLVLAHQFSHFLGHCSMTVPDRTQKHLSSVGLPTSISDIFSDDSPSIEDFMKFIEHDKKVRDGSLTFILSRNIGDAFIERDVSRESLRTFLSNVVGLG